MLEKAKIGHFFEHFGDEMISPLQNPICAK